MHATMPEIKIQIQHLLKLNCIPLDSTTIPFNSNTTFVKVKSRLSKLIKKFD